jgi:hypothetical protein
VDDARSEGTVVGARRAGRPPATANGRRALRLLAVLALTEAVAGCGDFRDAAAITGKTIRYQVEYFGSAVDAQSHSALTITYSTNEGEQQQRNVSLPWTKSIGPAGRGFTASVKAQFNGFGTISCRIVADSEVIVTQTSSLDPYAEVACSA